MKIENKYIELIKDKFKEYIGNRKLINIKKVRNILTQNQLNDLYEYVKTLPVLNQMDINDGLKQLIRLVLNDRFIIKQCLVCNKYLTIDYIFDDRFYCSKECKNKDKDRWLEKTKQTNLKKYGNIWSGSSQNNRIKSKQTLLKKYGKQNIYEVEQIIQKRKQTNLKKYGSEYFIASEEGKQKKRQTCLEKYGVDCVLKSKNIHKQIQQTNLKKYGVKYNLQVPQIRKQIQQTNLKKYGDVLPSKSQLIKEKHRIKNLKSKYKILKQKGEYIPLFEEDDIGNIKTYNWKCSKCGNVFQFNDFYTNKHIPRCLKCYPYCNGISLEEKELVEFLKEFVQFKTHDRTLINPYELDIVLPEKKIAIQFNGSYYHSEHEEFKDNNYHLNKTELCQKNGYQLIHIWEYQWLINKQLIKQKLKAILNINQTNIYGRKCIIKQISSKQKNEFLNKYHIQGQDKCNIKLGLYFNQQLVGVMTFCKPRFNKNYEYELSRYATKSGYRVLGGAGKLLKYFQKNYNPKSIITYADRSYSKGNLYFKLGFELLTKTKPNYIYTNNKIILTRYQCQKHKLKELLGNKFNPNLSQSQNMWINHYYKIFDSGNLVFTKNHQ